MEGYTKEEFEILLNNFQNVTSEMEKIMYEIEQTTSESHEFNINTIKDKNLREYVKKYIEMVNNVESQSNFEQEMENAAHKMLRGYFDFERFTNQNWKTFISNEYSSDFMDIIINNSDENMQAKILNAMLESQSYVNFERFSEGARKKEFIYAIEKKNKNLINEMLSYIHDKDVIRDKYSEIVEICGEDKEMISRLYNMIRDEIIESEPKLMEQTLEALKGTSYIVQPWRDAKADTQIKKKDIFPEIIRVNSEHALEIWLDTNDSVKEEKFTEIFEALKDTKYSDKLPSLWIESNYKIQEDNSYLLSLMFQKVRGENNVEKIWKNTSKKVRNDEFDNIVKALNYDPFKLMKIWEIVDDGLKIESIDEVMKSIVNYIPKENMKHYVERIWDGASENVKQEIFSKIVDYIKEDESLIGSFWKEMSPEAKIANVSILPDIIDSLGHSYIFRNDAHHVLDGIDVPDSILKQAFERVKDIPSVILSLWSNHTSEEFQKDNVQFIVEFLKHDYLNKDYAHNALDGVDVPDSILKLIFEHVRDDSIIMLSLWCNNTSEKFQQENMQIFYDLKQRFMQDKSFSNYKMLADLWKYTKDEVQTRIVLSEIDRGFGENSIFDLIEFTNKKDGSFENYAKDMWKSTNKKLRKQLYIPLLKKYDNKSGLNYFSSLLSDEMTMDIIDNILKEFKDNPDKICTIWNGLRGNTQIQEDSLYKIIGHANGNIEQIVNLWAGTNEKTQNNNVMRIYNFVKNLEKSTNNDIVWLLENTNIESLTKLFNNLTNENGEQLFYDFCKKLSQGTRKDIEKLNAFLKKCNQNIDIDAEKITDILMMEDASYLAEKMSTEIFKNDVNINSEINTIHQIFLTNELPEVFKIHQFFLFHQNHEESNLNLYSTETSIEDRDKKILGDLFLTALESNNKQMKDFLELIHNGDIIYEKIRNEKNINELDEAIMLQYRDVLYGLFNYKSMEKLDKTKDVLGDIESLREKLELNNSVKIGNRLLDNFLGETELQFKENIVSDGSTTGYLLAFMDSKLQEAFHRNTQPINVKTLLNEGDLIKGTHIIYLPGQLRNGLRSKEFNMVGDLYSDGTPFDTDFSEIKKKNLDGKTNIMEIINSTFTKTEYGNTYLVIGKDDYDKERSYAIEDGKNSTRYIRTAEGSTSIKAIITSEWDEKYAYSMAQEGIYIPVIDTKTEEILFNKEQYDKIREKMKGMTFYRADDFEVDKNVENEIILENARKLKEKAKNEVSTEEKKAKVIEYINAVLPKTVVQDMTGDASRQNIELIDTGSTGRGTNIPGDGDFDFMLKCVDNRERVNMISIIGGKLNGKVKAGTNELNLRYEDVIIDGLGVPVDIDVTSEKKSLAVEYSSDMCVRDRLDNIEKVYGEEKRKSVVDNIIVAKKKLKEAGLYKKVGSDKATSFGGFGGIGVENWILQNGGSFILAMETFLDNTKDKDGKDIGFEEFKKVYPIYDFGQDHREDVFSDGHDRYSDGLSSKRF